MYKVKATLFFLLASLIFLGWQPNREQWLLVVHAQKGKLMGNTLQLEGVGNIVTGFSSGETREIKAISIDDLVSRWDELYPQQPNAAIVSKDKDQKIAEQVVVLYKPKYRGDQLLFPVKEVGPPHHGNLGETLIYIDGAFDFTRDYTSDINEATE